MAAPKLSQLLQQAITLHRTGALGAAAQLYQQIITQDPRHADAYQLLGVIARQMGNSPLAHQLLEQAVQLQPRHAQALSNLALLLREQGDLPAALVRARAAVAAEPTLAEALIALGGVLAAQRDYAAALPCLRRALAQQPAHILLLNDIANVEARLGQFAAADAAINQAITHAPTMAMLHHTRGNILRSAGYPDLATACYATALEHDHSLVAAQNNAALCHLLLGDFARGWALYTTRNTVEPRLAALPEWDGKTAVAVLIYAEQGLGDTLQFVRLVRAARQVANRVVLEVQAPLLQLLQDSLGAAEGEAEWCADNFTIITPDMPLPAGLAARCRMLDLPRFFTVPPVPYLAARTNDASVVIAAQKSPRLGLVWAGNAGHLNDANRSLTLAQLAPIVQPYQQYFIALQKGTQIAELAASGLAIPDGGAGCHSFADTAALIQSLDLVVTVDTSVAHLAGGLGVPVWLLLPYDPDWRWLLQRKDSPWYPAMKLYRQQHPHDWSAALQHVGADLARLIAGDRSVLQPEIWHGVAAQRPEMPVPLKL